MQGDIELDHQFLAPYDVRWCVAASNRDHDLEHVQSGPLILTNARVSGIEAVNEPIARSDTFARLDLTYVRSGEITVVARDTQITVGAGEMILLDHEEPYSLQATSDTDCLCVLMPKYWLARQNPRCEHAMFKTLDTSSAFVATMKSFLEEWESAAQGPAHMIGVQFGGLLSLITASGNFGEAPLSSKLADTIIATIREQCTSPLLNAERVAAGLKMSRRHLYATLAKAGTTFGQELMTARLEASRLLLANPEYNSLKIGEVAYLMGFHDQGHFNRRFRLRYRQKPSEIRNSALARATTRADEK